MPMDSSLLWAVVSPVSVRNDLEVGASCPQLLVTDLMLHLT